MKSKFDFYEIVKIKTIDPQKSEVNGKKGYVAAKAVSDIRDHNPGSWTYAVSLFDIKYAWSFSENELEATGNFFDKTKIPNHGSIKVAVDSNGVGKVKPSYTSYAEIEAAINSSQASKASGYMLEASMISNDLDIMYNLIDMSIHQSDYILRGSAYSALWRLLLRFKDKLSSQFLMKAIRIGLSDKNEHVLETVNYIMGDLQSIAPDIWKQINKYK